jgi:uncharacterized protein
MRGFSDRRLPESGYVAFPLQMSRAGPRLVGRVGHVRQIIEQVLFTAPGERVFRPGFGVGVGGLVFDPAAAPPPTLVRKRVQAALAEALVGEVDPATLDIEVEPHEERLHVIVRYQLATIGRRQQEEYWLGGTAGG